MRRSEDAKTRKHRFFVSSPLRLNSRVALVIGYTWPAEAHIQEERRTLMATAPSGPAYRIHTDRLIIRCWQPQDAPLLQAAISQSIEHLRPWMPWIDSEPEDLQTKIERLRRFRGLFDLGQDFIYAIFNADETQVLGGTGLHTRIGAGGDSLRSFECA
jgi:RimJ/RimL family protein N-acetyltransferase